MEHREECTAPYLKQIITSNWQNQSNRKKVEGVLILCLSCGVFSWFAPTDKESVRAAVNNSDNDLHHAYLRLREILGAFDTPYGPSVEQVWAHTESKARQLIKERDKALQDAKHGWEDTNEEISMLRLGEQELKGEIDSLTKDRDNRHHRLTYTIKELNKVRDLLDVPVGTTVATAAEALMFILAEYKKENEFLKEKLSKIKETLEEHIPYGVTGDTRNT